MKNTPMKKLISLVLCLAMVISWLPRIAAAATEELINTVADPQTLTRPETIYGDSTLNAGKVTVGKSVSTSSVTINGQTVSLDDPHNFLIAISQSAQVMGLATESNVPVDVVFVLDTSGSMDDNDRAETMVTAANSAISTLMSANEHNRVAVVAFSSEGYGNGSSNGEAANVLSSLAHYSDDAATSHLRWVTSSGSTTGSDRVYIAGRDTVTVSGYPQNRTVNAFRHGKSGGTNIQSGIIEGARILTEVTSTTHTDAVSGDTVTRIPFLIILSDGQPTYSFDDEYWYDPATTNEQGPGSSAYEGNGFIAAMTAAYYKGLISRHYYGDNAGGDNQCYVYTMGIELDSLSGDEKTLAQITLDPKTYTTGAYAEEGAGSYWNYGNTANDNSTNAAYGWKTYWNNYLAGTASFGVRVDSEGGTYVWTGSGEPQSYYEMEAPVKPTEPRKPQEPGRYASNWQWQQYYQRLEEYEANMVTYNQQLEAYNAALEPYNTWLAWRDANFTYVSGEHYTFTTDSIAASKEYISSIAYNDEYFSADSVSEMSSIFEQLVTTIQQKAISVPTKVTTGNHDFDGYVTFTDPLGEYMEVKDMKGILADGYFYQGASFAQKLAKYGTAEADAEFDAAILNVVKSRMQMTNSNVDINSYLEKMKASSNQAYYHGPEDYDNSMVWWGNAYHSGEEDEQVQPLDFAGNDTIAFIEAQKAAGTIPAGADYVCRSYFFYGEAGGTNPNPDHEYLYFIVRVQRELAAPYRQSVIISAPASLLSMEKVLIRESFENGSPVYTATVEHREPARVVYEVGLWDSITPENVAYMVSQEYASETVNGTGSVNYDPVKDTYNFFSNDWDRSQTLDSHHRGMAKATFDAAADNAFYTYQQNTLVVDAQGQPVTSNPAGTTAYYTREYYTWSEDKGVDGTYSATKQSKLIEVAIPASTSLIEEDGKWYIPKGAYTAATLVVNGDDTVKSTNDTGTSSIVAHPHRTGDASNSHYTVFLGNNGMLSMKSDPYIPQKTVSVNLPASATKLVDDDGKPVLVGDVLTYTVEVKNTLAEAADLTVTDYVPLGTAFVAGSAGSGTEQTGHEKDASLAPDSNNVLTWVLKDVPAGSTRYVSFQTVVTEAALQLAAVPGNITNTALYRINNSTAVSSNTTRTHVYGKTVTDVNGQSIDGTHGHKVGDILVYNIRFHNNATDSSGKYVAADVTVTDRLPEGTTFLSADKGGTYDATTGTITWSFDSMAADTSRVVSFQVQINAAAKTSADGTQPQEGEIYLPNTATITVDNNPDIVLQTNTTENWADTGDMTITKTVAAGGDQTKVFTLNLSESSGLLDGTYVLLRGSASETVEFNAGKASVTISHGQTLTLKGLPAGAILTVTEDVSALPGWVPAYENQSVTIPAGAAAAVSSVSIVNTYHLQPLTLTLHGEKVMEGVAMNQAATFGFIAHPDSNNPVVGDPLTGQVTVQVPGRYSFDMSSKVFTQPGIYKYTISEIDGGLLGLTYDSRELVLVLTITDNADGTMSATATLDGVPFDMEQGVVSFTNRYVPESTQLELTANKAMTGRQLTAGEFHFQITDGKNTYKGINDSNGNIVFETISYTAAGVYSYTISEVVPADKATGITYDNSTYPIVVTVTDDNGQLIPTVQANGTAVSVSNNVADTGITFRNSFDPDDVPLTLVATKRLKSYNTATDSYEDASPEAGKFRFQVVNKATGEQVSTGRNTSDGKVTFNTIYFSQEMLEGAASKTFTYVVSEVIPELAKDPNMLYDGTKHEITVTLTKLANGNLSVAVGTDTDGTVDTGIAFVNYANPDSVEVRPTASKTTQNAPAGISFSFSVINTANGNEAAAGVGAANGTVSFSPLSFNAPGTYTYWIKESNAGNTTNGITYDAARYLMKVEVSRNSYNRLVAQVSYWSSAVIGSENVADYTVSASAPAFHNIYNAGGYINLTATKRLTGRSLRDGEFAFKLVRQDNGGEIDGIASANGTITFSTMYYSQADIPAGQTSAVIHYVMSEVIPATAVLPGITYDKTSHDVYVRITDNGNGTISTELVKPDGSGYAPISGTDTGVVFTNTYAAVEGDVVKYQIRKNLEGRDLRAGEFEFGLYFNGKLEDVATNDENGIVTFSRTIPATAASYAGMYKMVIKESVGSIAGISYSAQEYTVYVKVTDNHNGKIDATVHLSETGPALPEDANGMVDLTNEIVFTNTYEAHDTSYTPEATKQLNGRDMLTGEFTFQAQLIQKNGTAVSGGTVYSGINNAQGKVLFESIPYTEEGTYIYRVSELTGNHSGVKYDPTVYYLKVVVTDDGSGHLKTSAGYYSNEACTTGVSAVVFTNTYTASDATVQLEATKKLTGRKLVDREFSFLVRQNNANGKVVATGSNDAQGAIRFSTFDITSADMAGAKQKVFTYVIMESDNNIPGVKIDTTVHTVTVTVTDDGSGKLSAVIGYPEDQAIVFQNTYTPAEAKLPLAAFKTLSGKTLHAKDFSFLLTNEAGETVQTATNDANGLVRFEDLVFQKAGSYTYYLTEVDAQEEGMAYDKTRYTITVEVTDDLQGSLVAVATYKIESTAVELLQFSNTYTPASVQVDLEGTKVIADVAGNVLGLDLAGFEFEVKDVDGNLITTALSDGTGEIAFTDISFSAAGEYRLLISEKATTRPNYTTDPTVWCAHISIGYNADTGILSETGRYIHIAPETHDQMALVDEELIFVNVYDPDAVHLTLKIQKDLDGRALRDHEFSFLMVDDATGLRVAEARNHANGDVNFHLSYNEAGTYSYTISESVPAAAAQLGGVQYSKETYNVTVTVTDDGSGKLEATVGKVTFVGSETVDLTDSVVFHNTYEAKPATVKVNAVKHLHGKALKPDAYTFQLVNAQNASEKYTATNAADGTVSFDAITFTKADTYVYKLSEVAGSEQGVAYDAQVYTVTITVTDNGNGQLVAEKQISSENGVETVPVFNNYYTAAPAEYVPEVKKIFEGGAMRTFDFVLTGEGFETQTKQNNAEGDVTFDKLVFEKAGTYTFTIAEKADPSVTDIKWDTNVYTLTIQVTDNLSGSLVVTDIGITSEHGRHDLIFRNVHEDLITKKDVFLAHDTSIAINGMAVDKGDILTYTINYTNYTGKTADVTITDTIPAHTAYVADSADLGGTYADGVLTWKLTGIAPDEVVTVSFDVEVIGAAEAVENQAVVLEGDNTYHTNAVTVSVPEDKVVKDVVLASDPTVSIDGKEVKQGDILEYHITYTNNDAFHAEVEITDAIPAHTSLVEGSAGKDSSFADGVLTWKLFLAPGESKTVFFQVKVEDVNVSISNQATAVEGTNKLETNEVTVSVPEDKVVKDVVLVSDPTVSVDGLAVKPGDILQYKILYINSYEAAAEVTITDIVPAHTTYVEGSADQGAVVADGVLTWKLFLAPGESKTVSFQVKVDDVNVSIFNQATALEGENKTEIKSNKVTVIVPEDKVVKDVVLVSDPTVSIDGKTVKKGDVLEYHITYTNSFEAAADVTITDTVPAHTTYVDGSADLGGTYANGELTWKLTLEPGQSKTVSFQVKVNAADVSISNQATALEGDSKLQTNIVKNTVPAPVPETPQTGDDVNLFLWFALLSVSSLGIVATAMVAKKKEAEESAEENS